jgi:1D-myo-inositol-tetrakisphosphate 5-kinase/inositol-polyphosphate multikinase
MKLENLLEDMRHPCVLDIKMGRKTYDPFASQEKIAMETAKFPPAKKIGYQISGMQVRINVTIKLVYYKHGYCKVNDKIKLHVHIYVNKYVLYVNASF